MYAVAAEYPQSTLMGTPACSYHSSTALYGTYTTSQEEYDCVYGLESITGRPSYLFWHCVITEYITNCFTSYTALFFQGPEI